MTAASPRKKPEVLCTATNRWGQPCQRPPIRGGSVCATHGGRAPAVKRRAEQRILEASDKAAFRLVEMMQDKTIPPQVQLAAARDLLDRAGLGSRHEISIDAKVTTTWEDVLDTVLVDIEEPEGDDANIEDAVIVTPEVEARDREMEDRDAQRRRNASRGKSPALAPTEQQRIDSGYSTAAQTGFLAAKAAEQPNPDRPRVRRRRREDR